MHRRHRNALQKYCREGIWDTHHGMGRLSHFVATSRAIQTQIILSLVLWNAPGAPRSPPLRNRLLRGRAEPRDHFTNVLNGMVFRVVEYCHLPLGTARHATRRGSGRISNETRKESCFAFTRLCALQ